MTPFTDLPRWALPNGTLSLEALAWLDELLRGVPNPVWLDADVVDDAGVDTIRDITGLEFPVSPGETYWFRFVIAYTSAATTTGARFSIDGPAAPTLLAYTSRYPLTAATEAFTYAAAYDAPAAAGATSLTAGNVAVIEGIIKPAVAGTVIARFASEIDTSAVTALAGSLLLWMRKP